MDWRPGVIEELLEGVVDFFFWCSKRSFCTLVIKRGNGKSMNIHRLQ